MRTILEENLARALREALRTIAIDAEIERSDDFQRGILVALECFIPQILTERHGEWKGESLDGILPFQMRKIGAGAAEIIGHTILISDQTVVPIHLRLQASTGFDEISWLECRIGERQGAKMKRVPYQHFLPILSQLEDIAGNVDAIDWSYAVTFGHRQ